MCVELSDFLSQSTTDITNSEISIHIFKQLAVPRHLTYLYHRRSLSTAESTGAAVPPRRRSCRSCRVRAAVPAGAPRCLNSATRVTRLPRLARSRTEVPTSGRHAVSAGTHTDIDTQTHRHTDTDTQTQTHRHRHTDTDTQTQIHRHKYTDTYTQTQTHRHTDTQT